MDVVVETCFEDRGLLLGVANLDDNWHPLGRLLPWSSHVNPTLLSPVVSSHKAQGYSFNKRHGGGGMANDDDSNSDDDSLDLNRKPAASV